MSVVSQIDVSSKNYLCSLIRSVLVFQASSFILLYFNVETSFALSHLTAWLETALVIFLEGVFATNTTQKQRSKSSLISALALGISRKFFFPDMRSKCRWSIIFGEKRRAVEWASMYVAYGRYMCLLGTWKLLKLKNSWSWSSPYVASAECHLGLCSTSIQYVL